MGVAKKSGGLGPTELAVLIGGFSVLVLGIVLLIAVMAFRSPAEADIALAPTLPSPTQLPAPAPNAPDPTAGMTLAEAARFRAAERARLEEEHRTGNIPKPVALSAPKTTPAPTQPAAAPVSAPAVATTTPAPTTPSPYVPPAAQAMPTPPPPAPTIANTPPAVRSETVTAHVIHKEPDATYQATQAGSTPSPSRGRSTIRWQDIRARSVFGLLVLLLGGCRFMWASVTDADSFFLHGRKAAALAGFIGRDAARLVYFGLGACCLAGGLAFLGVIASGLGLI